MCSTCPSRGPQRFWALVPVLLIVQKHRHLRVYGNAIHSGILTRLQSLQSTQCSSLSQISTFLQFLHFVTEHSFTLQELIHSISQSLSASWSKLHAPISYEFSIDLSLVQCSDQWEHKFVYSLDLCRITRCSRTFGSKYRTTGHSAKRRRDDNREKWKVVIDSRSTYEISSLPGLNANQIISEQNFRSFLDDLYPFQENSLKMHSVYLKLPQVLLSIRLQISIME